MAVSNEAYCTLLTSDAYLPGAMVLAHSLRASGTKKQLAILVTLDNLGVSTIDELKKVYDQIIPVDRIVNRSPANLYLMNRPDLGSTFTKIALWRMIQFSHIVYIDADVVALRAPDELFRQTSSFAAVPDVGWPDCFNSGVLSLKPSMGDYYALLALADRGISFDGADQGLLNMHFRKWERLSFTYNCTPSGNYQYVPAYRHFQSSINMVHFIGHDKPWVMGRGNNGATGVYEELLGRWWAVYDKHFRFPTTAYISGQAPQSSRTVPQYVYGESATADYGFSTTEPPSVKIDGPEEPQESNQRGGPPEARVETTEPVMSDQKDLAEGLSQGEFEPTPTVEQRRYSIDWNPAYQPPPPDSKPEAANLPTETYSMSEDPSLFQPPPNPEPPKDMYYQVPPKVPAQTPRPPPIFPWETNQPKPTRVFLEDAPPPAPEPIPVPIEPTPTLTTDDDKGIDSPSPTSSAPQSPPPSESFERFSRTNAWDDMPEINRYISSLPQNRRAKLQVLLNTADPSTTSTRQTASTTETGSNEPLMSPPTAGPNIPSAIRLTDFPNEIERPSLPVTPAPVRRPSFWGAERDEAGDLPGAEGVPDQDEWDPSAKLVELARRQNEVLEKAAVAPESTMDASTSNANDGDEAVRDIPNRELLGSASLPSRQPGVSEAGETRSPETLARTGAVTTAGQSDLATSADPVNIASPPTSAAPASTAVEETSAA